MTASVILLVIALVIFVLAAAEVSSPVNLTAAGLAFTVLAMLLGGFGL